MIPASRTAVLLCTTLSLAAHAGVAIVAPKDEAPRIEGGTATAPAALGSSFADFAAGSARPAPPDALAPTPAPTPPAPAPATTSSSPQGVRAPSPQDATPAPATMAATAPTARDPSAGPAPRTASPAPADPAATAPAPPLTVVTAAPEEAGVAVSPRPAARPERFVELAPPPQPERHRARPKPEVARPQATSDVAPPAPSAVGNGSVNARKGTVDGSARGAAASSATGAARPQQAGNAAAANYSGQVLSRIARAKGGSLGTPRRVLVSFRIGPGGALAGVSVARSSGNARADQLALAQVRRAAPFPSPPPGARVSYSIEIGDQ